MVKPRELMDIDLGILEVRGCHDRSHQSLVDASACRTSARVCVRVCVCVSLHDA